MQQKKIKIFNFVIFISKRIKIYFLTNNHYKFLYQFINDIKNKIYTYPF